MRRCNQLNVGILLYEGILATSQFESDYRLESEEHFDSDER